MGQNLGQQTQKSKHFWRIAWQVYTPNLKLDEWILFQIMHPDRPTDAQTHKCSAFPCPSPDFISGDNKPSIWYGRTSRSCVELYVLLWKYRVSVQSYCLCSLSYPWTFNNLHEQIIILHWGGHKVGHQLHAWVLFCMDETWECFRALAGG